MYEVMDQYGRIKYLTKDEVEAIVPLSTRLWKVIDAGHWVKVASPRGQLRIEKRVPTDK